MSEVKTVVIWLLAGTPVTALAADDQPPSAAAIARAVAALDDSEWAAREAASRQLLSFGAAALPALARQAAQGSPEAAVRSVEILSTLYDRDDFPDMEALETELERLLAARGSPGEAARRAWEQHRPARERRAIARIEELGGRIDFSQEQRIDFDDQALPLIDHIVIGPKWKGGDDGIKHILKLSQVKRLYRVKGAPISDAARQKLEDAGFVMDDRGAFLGIGSSVQFGGEANGCEVDTVRDGSPAAQGGLQRGDLIVKFDDRPVKQFNDLIELLKESEPGRKVAFTVLRGGEALVLPVTLGDW
jgi:hypothetical protein